MLLMLSALLNSCGKEPLQNDTNTEQKTHPEGIIKLGKRLENLFTVENIRKAYNNLVKQWAIKSGIEISPTHQYNTPMFIDLIDNINQRVKHSGSLNYPNDNVTGYTIAKLEQLLYAFRDLDLLEETLQVNKPSGVTNESIKELVGSYKTFNSDESI